jgi:ribosomal protein S12 methylthiotransferase
LQHFSDPVLHRMRRQITSAETRELLAKIREIHTEIRLRTTFLVGFPGETEEDHEALCRFVEQARFDRVGVFEYSHEEGTRGYDLVDDVPAEIKKQRAEEIMAIQQSISLALNESMIGRKMKILVDRKEAGQYVGRSEYDSPEVDNEIWIDPGGQKLTPGEFIMVEIKGASEYDLNGIPLT